MKHYGGRLLRLLRPWGTRLTTPFPPQTSNRLRFRCTATGCSASTRLYKNGYVRLFSTFIWQRLDQWQWFPSLVSISHLPELRFTSQLLLEPPVIPTSSLVIFRPGVGAFKQIFGPRGDLNKNFPKIQMPGELPGGGDVKASTWLVHKHCVTNNNAHILLRYLLRDQFNNLVTNLFVRLAVFTVRLTKPFHHHSVHEISEIWEFWQVEE